MTIHPRAIHWEKAVCFRNGRTTGCQSEIGCTYRAPDGWHAEVYSGHEDLGPFRSDRQAQIAAENFVNSGYVR